MHAIRPKLFFRDHGNVRQNLHNRFCCRLAFTMASKKCLAVTCTDGTDDVVVNCPSLIGKVFTFRGERDCQTSYNQETHLQFVKDHVDFGIVCLHCFQPFVKQGMGLRQGFLPGTSQGFTLSSCCSGHQDCFGGELRVDAFSK